MEEEVENAVKQVTELGATLKKSITDLNSDFRKELEKLEGQIKEQGSAKDTIVQLKGIEERIKGIEEKHGQEISQLAVKLNRTDFQRKESAETLNVSIKSALEKLVEGGLGRSGKFNGSVDLKSAQEALTLKTVGDMSNANLSGYAARDIRTRVVYDPVASQRLRDLITVSPLTAPILEYPKETGGEGNVGFQTEGSAKPQADLDFTMVSETPKTIAVWSRLTKQSIADISWLASHLARRLSDKWYDFEDNQIINGNGTGQQFKGLVNQGTAYTKTAGIADNHYEYLIDAIGQLETAYYRTSGILIHPLDFVKLLVYKASSNGEFTHPGLVYGADNILRLYGVPIIKNSAISRLTAIVGDFRQADLAVREGLSFGAYYEDANNVTENKVTYLLEGREVLAIYDGKAFRVINFATFAS